jgi:hypothetical protein
VVAGEREVVAAEALARDREVAAGGGQRPARVEALVDPPPLCPQPVRRARAIRPLGASDAPGQPAAGGQVHLQPEQVLRGLGEDLREAAGPLGIVARDHLGTAGALHEDERLEQVRVELGRPRRGLDLRAPAGRSPRGGGRAARALRVEHVAEPGGGTALELGAPVGVVGQRVRLLAGRAAAGDHAALVAARGDHGDGDGDRGGGEQREGDQTASAARGHAPNLAARRKRS